VTVAKIRSIYDAGFWYASVAGWPVFPVTGKVPLPGSRGSRDATTDTYRLDRQFVRACRRRRDEGLAPLGIAVATGHELPGGGFLFVVDVDPRNDGDCSIEQLESEHGSLPETWTVRTPSGGWHYYFRTPEPYRNSTGDPEKGTGVAPGIDTRGRGGYVVAPVSAGYVVERKVSRLADAPAWLLARCVAWNPEPSAPVEVPRLVGSPYVRAAIEAEAREVATAAKGTRNSRLHAAAVSLSRFVVRGQADRDAVHRVLIIAAAASGLPEREADRTIVSAYEWRRVSA
jgi:hypothetical protein